MKLNFFLLASASAACPSDCQEVVDEIDAWQDYLQDGSNNLQCNVAEDCDEVCMIECRPVYGTCPAAASLEKALWSEKGKKIMKKYVKDGVGARKRRGADSGKEAKKQTKEERREAKEWRMFMSEERRLARQFQKRGEERRVKTERSNKRKRRNWENDNKNFVKFYASIEEAYKSICPDLNLERDLGSEHRYRPIFPGVLPPRTLSLPHLDDCVTLNSNNRLCVPKTRPSKCSSEEAQLTYKKLSTNFYEITACEPVCKIDASQPILSIKALTGPGEHDDSNDDKFFRLVKPESVVQECLFYDGRSMFEKWIEMDRQNHDDFENNQIELFEYNWPEVDVNCLKDMNEITIGDISGNGWRAMWLHVIVNDVKNCQTITYEFDGSFWVDHDDANEITRTRTNTTIEDQWEHL